MAEVDIDGVKIWYDVHGEGTEHLLQIGGAGFAHENFGFVTHLMTPHFKVIETDLRGYGNSERPEQKYSMDLWADDLKAVLDAAGISKVALLSETRSQVEGAEIRCNELVDWFISTIAQRHMG